MEKLFFDSDYMEGAIPEILKKLIVTNFEKTAGYGLDEYSESAKRKIREAIANPDADVYLLVGGTQSNATVIDSLLKSYEGVLACDSGHIAVHEAGAVEQSSHKVITIPNRSGKVDPADLKQYFELFEADANHDHEVPVGAVYISHPTELGTLYTKQELKDLYEICQKNNAYLFLDGARLGYGLAAKTDVTLQDVAKYTDVFYIGGTKVGALFGEAVVFKNRKICPKFFTLMKRHGALLAKGRIPGIQFDTLFSDDNYMKYARHAIALADKLEAGFRAKNYQIAYESPTNQKFILIENTKMEELKKKVSFSFWETYDKDHTVIRFVTSWATREEDVDRLLEII